MEQETYTALEVAALLAISRETVMRWCRLGRFPGCYKYLGSRKLGWRIPARAIAYIKEGQHERTLPIALPSQLERDQPIDPD